MKLPEWVNKLLVAIYAASGSVLTLLVDQHVIGIHTAADIGVIITTFAAGYHGSQAVAAQQAKTTP